MADLPLLRQVGRAGGLGRAVGDQELPQHVRRGDGILAGLPALTRVVSGQGIVGGETRKPLIPQSHVQPRRLGQVGSFATNEFGLGALRFVHVQGPADNHSLDAVVPGELCDSPGGRICRQGGNYLHGSRDAIGGIPGCDADATRPVVDAKPPAHKVYVYLSEKRFSINWVNSLSLWLSDLLQTSVASADRTTMQSSIPRMARR